MKYLVRKVGNQIIYGWFDDWHYGKPMWVIGLAKRLGKLPEFLREYAASQLTVSH